VYKNIRKFCMLAVIRKIVLFLCGFLRAKLAISIREVKAARTRPAYAGRVSCRLFPTVCQYLHDGRLKSRPFFILL